jgi:putative transposase
MTYIPRIEVPGGVYHVVTRGNNKRSIFEDDFDRHLFVQLLWTVARAYGWTIFAYCLMGNHYHLVIQLGPGERSLSRAMCLLNTAWASEYNSRHGRINHLFGKRYWSRLLRDDADLLANCRYAINNPVRAGLVDDPSVWVWSSYRATVGLALGIPRLAVDEFLRLFAPERERAIELWREYVAAARSGPDPRQPPLRE